MHPVNWGGGGGGGGAKTEKIQIFIQNWLWASQNFVQVL